MWFQNTNMQKTSYPTMHCLRLSHLEPSQAGLENGVAWPPGHCGCSTPHWAWAGGEPVLPFFWTAGFYTRRLRFSHPTSNGGVWGSRYGTNSSVGALGISRLTPRHHCSIATQIQHGELSGCESYHSAFHWFSSTDRLHGEANKNTGGAQRPIIAQGWGKKIHALNACRSQRTDACVTEAQCRTMFIQHRRQQDGGAELLLSST